MVVIKFHLNNDIRRVTLSNDELSYVALTSLAKNLFSSSLPNSFIFKYKDDEGDLVSVSSERELVEAFRLIGAQQILRLHIVCVEEPKQDRSDTSTCSGKDASFFSLLEKLISENSFVRDLFNNVEIEVKSVPTELKNVFQQNGFSFGSSSSPRSDVQSSSEHRVHYGVTCDHCHQHNIQGDRFKCTACPDFDLCERCYPAKDSVHDSSHSFNKITEPINYGHRRHHFRGPFARGPVPQSEVVHMATCDGCNTQIKGIRYKCKDCPDYDLCESCEANKVAIHPDHSFDAIHRPRCPFGGQHGGRFGRHPHCRRGSRGGHRDEATQVNSNGTSDAVKSDDNCSPVRIPVRSVSFVEAATVPDVVEPIRSSSTPVSPVVPHAEVSPVVPATPEPVIEDVAVIEIAAPVVTDVPVVESIKVEPVKIEPVKIERSPFEDKLVQLEEMGFSEKALNIELLVKYKGDMLQTVRHLLDN